MITKEKIQEWNDYFNSLSSEGKRVAIAKDVIEQIEANKYVSLKGKYGSIKRNTLYEFSYDDSVQSIFDEVNCNCCALGAMFMSNVKFNNQCTVNQVGKVDKIVKDLTNFFSAKQLIMIESAFEQWDWSDLLRDEDDDDYYSDIIMDGIFSEESIITLNLDRHELIESIEKAYNFTKAIDNDEERLVKIMTNIIENNGEFIPN